MIIKEIPDLSQRSNQRKCTLPSSAYWQQLPQRCILVAIMLEVKGLLALQACREGFGVVNTVDVSLAPE